MQQKLFISLKPFPIIVSKIKRESVAIMPADSDVILIQPIPNSPADRNFFYSFC